jgi:hypothetical protein
MAATSFAAPISSPWGAARPGHVGDTAAVEADGWSLWVSRGIASAVEVVSHRRARPCVMTRPRADRQIFACCLTNYAVQNTFRPRSSRGHPRFHEGSLGLGRRDERQRGVGRREPATPLGASGRALSGSDADALRLRPAQMLDCLVVSGSEVEARMSWRQTE